MFILKKGHQPGGIRASQGTFSSVIMCCSPHRFADRAETHYHTRAWQTLIHGKECFILLLKHACDSLMEARHKKLMEWFAQQFHATLVLDVPLFCGMRNT